MSNVNILGYSPTWGSADVTSVIPWAYLMKNPTPAMRAARRLVLQPVSTQMPVTYAQPKIQWTVPSNSSTILDFSRGGVKITFNCTVSGGSPAWSVRPSNLVWNICDNFRLFQGGQFVEERRYFGQEETLTYVTQTHRIQELTTAVELWGAGDRATRNARHTGGANYTYFLPIPTSSIVKTVLPWFQMMKSGTGYSPSALPDTMFEWNLASPEQFLEIYGGTGSYSNLQYQITEMYVFYEEIYMNETVMKNFLMSWAQSFTSIYPSIFYRTFYTNTYQILGGATYQTIQMDFKFSSFIAIYCHIRSSEAATDPTALDKFEYYVGTNVMPISQYQWRINDQLWPDQPIAVNSDGNAVEAYRIYQVAFNMFHSRGIHEEVTPIGQDSFQNDKFVLVLDLNQHPFSDNTLNPVATSNSNSYISLYLWFSSAPPSGYELVSSAYYWRIWNFGAKGINVSMV